MNTATSAGSRSKMLLPAGDSCWLFFPKCRSWRATGRYGQTHEKWPPAQRSSLGAIF